MFDSLTAIYKITRKIEDGVSKRHIIYADEPFVLEVATERIAQDVKNGDLSLIFAKEYKKAGYLRDGRKILIIRAAIGATGFMHGQWGLHAPLYFKMVEMLEYALSLNEGNRLVAFLWHQGEHEVGNENPPDIYENQLRDMLLDFRARFNADGVPMITADFSPEWRGTKREKAKAISDKINKVFGEMGGAFLNTDDLLSNNMKNSDGDVIHFCRESLYTLGERYFEAYKGIIIK